MSTSTPVQPLSSCIFQRAWPPESGSRADSPRSISIRTASRAWTELSTSPAIMPWRPTVPKSPLIPASVRLKSIRRNFLEEEMKRFDFRILIGAVLVLGGILMLLDQTGILRGATRLFWSGILAIGAALFLYWFFSERSRWWAAIPGFTLAGIAASSVLLDRLGWGGLAVLGGIGVGFWAVYLRDRRSWWAIIPGGVMLTLGVISAMTEAYQVVDTGGVLFVGLGITFLLVGFLANLKWSYIPAAVMLLLGILLGTPFVGLFQFVWIGVLLVAGVLLILSSLRSRR